MPTNRTPVVFISWAPFCSRSDGIGSRLGGKSYMVYSAGWGSRYATILFKYLSQSIKTIGILIRERPKVVLVMSPPVIACFPVWLYTIFTGGRFAIDAHTAAFVDPRWLRFIALHKFFSRRAVATFVTSEAFETLVESWGATAQRVADVHIDFPPPTARTLSEGTNLTVINTFTPDEPLDLILAAASRCPEVHFYITGRHKDAPVGVLENKSDNVTFTDFLPDAEYVGQLLASDAVMCLTTLDNTMQRGAYEAAYLGVPIITSNFQLLRDNFNYGTVHVDNSVEDIVRGVNDMRDTSAAMREEIQTLRDMKIARWNKVEITLRQLLGLAPRSADS